MNKTRMILMPKNYEILIQNAEVLQNLYGSPKVPHKLIKANVALVGHLWQPWPYTFI